MMWMILATVAALLVMLGVKIHHWLESRTNIPSLHTRHVLITGCDTGFGKRLAIRLDKMGCHVFAACLTSSGAKELSTETSERVKTVLMDVTKDEDIERVAKEVEEALPNGRGLWGIVNNAGVMGSMGPAEMMTRKDYLIPLQVNLLGMTQVTRMFLPLVRKEQGRIVNTTSVASRVAWAPAPYGASKFAAGSFTDALRRELYQHEITVHDIQPGAYNTNILGMEANRSTMTRLFEAAAPTVRGIYGDDYIDKIMVNMDLMRRYLMSSNPEEVVDAYVHALMSKRPSRSYVVGWMAHLVYRPLWMCPTALADFLIGQFSMVPPKKLS